MVPTASMQNTIMTGDHYFLLKFPYGPSIPGMHLRLPKLHKIRRGEIVAFHSPFDSRSIFLKRVVAVGGDKVEFRGNMLLVNGEKVKEPYALFSGPSVVRNSPISTIVPAGHLFMLGDNRNHSEDSRYWGTVPEEDVVGAPLFIFWSYDAPSFIWLDHNFTHQCRFYASAAMHFFSNTRWARIGFMP